jgi:hypothetical protein
MRITGKLSSRIAWDVLRACTKCVLVEIRASFAFVLFQTVLHEVSIMAVCGFDIRGNDLQVPLKANL